MRKFNLYAILDKEVLGSRSLIDTAKELIKKGVSAIQYRDKRSSIDIIFKNSIKLRELDISVLIINDYPAIARDAGADGVHLGQKDTGIAEARAILGKNKIIGCSTHTIEQALKAEQESADYIGIGPVFYTDTKKELSPIGLDTVRKVARYININAVAIGGIRKENLDSVLNTGIQWIASASGILKENFPWDRLAVQEKEKLLKK